MSDASGQDQTGRPNWKTTFNFLFRTDQGVVSADVWWRGTIALAAALLFLHFVWEAISSQPREPLSERGGVEPFRPPCLLELPRRHLTKMTSASLNLNFQKMKMM